MIGIHPRVSRRVLLVATAIYLCVGTQGAVAGGGGHRNVSNQMKAQADRRLAMGMASRGMTSKPPVHLEKGSKDGTAYAHMKHKGCGKLVVPTAGCATPTRDPVGNTRPSLPTEAKQPVDKSRQPVLEYVKKPGPQSANEPASAPARQRARRHSLVSIEGECGRRRSMPPA
jgi:hypothetical protein